MRNFNKLLELHSNGVKFTISNRRYNSSGNSWNFDASKDSDGVSFQIDKYGDDLEDLIDEVHSTWVAMTPFMPEHRLAVIEHRPETPPEAYYDEMPEPGNSWEEEGRVSF